MSAEIVNPWKGDRIALAVLGIYVSLLGVALGVYARAWLPVILMPLIGLSLVTTFALDHPYVVLNDEGVTVRILVTKRFLSWKYFRQAGICLFENKKPGGVSVKFYRIGLLMPGGVPKWPGRRFQYTKNKLHVVLLPDTREIRDCVIAHYGLLDFDESADPRGYSIVVD